MPLPRRRSGSDGRLPTSPQSCDLGLHPRADLPHRDLRLLELRRRLRLPEEPPPDRCVDRVDEHSSSTSTASPARLQLSVIVAVITMVAVDRHRRARRLCALALRLPRQEAFRFLVVMTRAFPLPLLALPLAVMFIRTGLDDTVVGLALVHTTLALPFAVLDHLLALLRHPGRARGGRLDARLHPAAGLPQGGRCRWRCPGIAASAVFAFTISWNEVFAAAVLTIENRTLTAFLLQSLNVSPLYRSSPAARPGRAGADLHLRRPQVPASHVGHRATARPRHGGAPMAEIAIKDVAKRFGASPPCIRST